MPSFTNTQSSQETTPEVIKVIAESDPIAVTGSSNSIKPRDNKDIYASFGKRFLASLIDNSLLIVIGIVITVAGIINFASTIDAQQISEYQLQCQTEQAIERNKICRDFLDGFAQTAFYTTLIILVLTSLYRIILPMTGWQGTIGKRVMKLRIVDENNLKINWLQAFSRESFGIILLIIHLATIPIPQIATLFPILALVILQSGLQVIWSPNKQSTEDGIARTFVIQL